MKRRWSDIFKGPPPRIGPPPRTIEGWWSWFVARMPTDEDTPYESFEKLGSTFSFMVGYLVDLHLQLEQDRARLEKLVRRLEVLARRIS